jgi:hypothetical protein
MKASHNLLLTPGGPRPVSRGKILLRGTAVTPQVLLKLFLSTPTFVNIITYECN